MLTSNPWEIDTWEATCTLCGTVDLAEQPYLELLRANDEDYFCERCNKLLAKDKWDLVSMVIDLQEGTTNG
jgi:hypothetical protein